MQSIFMLAACMFHQYATVWISFNAAAHFREIVGNKAKRRISKRVFQESKAHQNLRKTNISYPLIRTRTCAYQEVRNICF